MFESFPYGITKKMHNSFPAKIRRQQQRKNILLIQFTSNIHELSQTGHKQNRNVYLEKKKKKKFLKKTRYLLGHNMQICMCLHLILKNIPIVGVHTGLHAKRTSP